MGRKSIARIGLIGMLLGMFAIGYVCGSVGTPRASAQLPQIPGVSGQSGGALGAVMQLGSSIKEMDEHVTGLQKNLEPLRKVQSALGGK